MGHHVSPDSEYGGWVFPGDARGKESVGLKNLSASSGYIDSSLISGSGQPPGRGHSNPLQYPCLENPMDRGAWWATVHRVAKSPTGLKQLSTYIYTQDTKLICRLWRMEMLSGSSSRTAPWMSL